ncbi:MAG: nucleoid-associated protein [Clostridium fessum]
MEVGPDFSDFLKAHIEKITESDDVKHCTFAEGSEVKELLQNCTPDNFVETSKQLAERLYDIMNANIDIPAADVAMTVFGCKGKDYLAFLKMNYKTSYTHQNRKRTAATATRSFYSAHCFRDRDSASPRRLSSISPTAP